MQRLLLVISIVLWTSLAFETSQRVDLVLEPFETDIPFNTSSADINCSRSHHFDPLFGKSSLVVELTFPDTSEVPRTIDYFLPASQAPYSCQGASHLSVWYKVLDLPDTGEQPVENNHLRIRMRLFDESPGIKTNVGNVEALTDGAPLVSNTSDPLLRCIDCGWRELTFPLQGGHVEAENNRS